MAKEPDCTKGYGARKLVYSLQQRFVGLSKDKIQVIFNCDKCDYRQNLRILNRAKLKPIRGMWCLYQTSRSSYGYGNYKSQWSFLSIDICYQSWMCSVGLYGASFNNQCQCYPRRRLVPVNWRHTTSVWHLSSTAQLSFRVDKKIAQSMQTCCAGSFTKNVFTQNGIIVTLLKQKWTDVAKNLPTTYSMLSERTFHTISSWIWTILSLF